MDNFYLEEIKVILLSGKTNSKVDFETLCKNNKFKEKNLHLLECGQNGKLKWMQTFGDLELIRKYALNGKKSTIKLKEDYFYNLNVKNEQITIISDEAGMGKSSFMMNLSRNLTQNSFVIKIDLTKYFKELGYYQKNLPDIRDKRSIEFLCSLNIFKTDLEIALIKNFSNNRIKLNLVVLFDGLDEISPYYNDAVIDIVDDLKQMNEKIGGTTRPHL